MHLARAIAYRVAAHGLAARRPPSLLREVIGACGIPDVPSGAANLALHARLDHLDRLIPAAALRNGALFSIWGLRRMTYLVQAPDVLVFGLGSLPDREEALRSVLGPDQEAADAAGVSAAAALAMVAAAMTEVLGQGALTREELSASLHGRLPAALEPWCGACRSSHVPESLFRMGATAAGAIAGGGEPERYQLGTQGLAEVPAGHLGAARVELVRRFLRCFGPSTPEAFAGWAGTGTGDAVRRWNRLAGELVELDLDGPAWMLRESVPLLRSPPPMRGARLLSAGDPFLQQRDRATLLRDFDARRRLWRPSGGPGLVLLDGEPVGLWRARWGLRSLEVRMEQLRPVTDPERDEIAAETQRLAEFQGLAQGMLSLG